MNSYLHRVSRRIANLSGVGRLFLAAFALSFVPFSVAMAERRTQFLVGYIPHPGWMAATIVAALLCVAVARWPADFRPAATRFLLLAVLLVPFVDPELQIALFVASATGLAACFKKTEGLAKAGLAGSGILILAAFVANVFGLFDTQFDISPILAPLFAFLSIGRGAVMGNGNVGFDFDGTTRIVHASADKIGGIYFAVLLATFVALAASRRIGFLKIFAGIGIALLYSIARGLYTIAESAGYREAVWWDEAQLFLSFLPLAFVLAALLVRTPAPVIRPSRRLSTAVCLTGIALAMLGWSFIDPGIPKRGTVLLDETHGEWEDSRGAIDTNWYGSRTVYNYYDLSQSLKQYFDFRTCTTKLDDETLRDVSVLILKTPTQPYDDTAVESIVRFVNRGGGLWLVGDHTDAFGMSTYLNEIATRFNLKFRKDAYVEYPVQRNLWSPTSMSHPIVHSLPTFLFYTGCSLEMEPLDTPLMVGNRLTTEGADYSAGSFFGPLKTVPTNKESRVVMAVLAQRGPGRVAMWSDSTLFSNFSIYMPGKLELAVNTIEWLSRRNAYDWLRLVAMGLGALGMIVGLRRASPTAVVVALVFAAGLAPLARAGFAAIRPLTKIRENVERRDVAFLEDQASPHLPNLITIDEKGPYFYLSSFVGVQRAGLRPALIHDVAEIGSIPKVVYIPGTAQLSGTARKKLENWVRNGGQLLILDGGKASNDELLDWGKTLGLTLVDRKEEFVLPLDIQNGAKKLLGKDRVRYRIRGGIPMLTYDGDQAVCGALVPLGQGSVFLSTTTKLFSDDNIGDVHHVPDDAQLATLTTLFDLYRKPVGSSGHLHAEVGKMKRSPP